MQLEFPLGSDPRFPQLRHRLLASYGPQRDPERLSANARFVDGMFSKCTRDAVSGRALGNVCTSLASWDDLARYSPIDLQKLISEVEYSEQKSLDLLAAVRAIVKERGYFDLRFLGSLPVETAFTWLVRFDGVGPKVAAATLNFSELRMRCFVLDRHVLRILGCIGILSSKTDFKSGFYKVMPLLPREWDADDLYELHWLMKMHGQRVCRPTHPKCGACVLSDVCAHATPSARVRKFVDEGRPLTPP